MVDNSNAVSAIGTLDFLDRIAKYNTVNTTCNPEKFDYDLGFAGIKKVYKEIYNTSTKNGGKSRKAKRYKRKVTRKSRVL
jgi:hypothetical protein